MTGIVRCTCGLRYSAEVAMTRDEWIRSFADPDPDWERRDDDLFTRVVPSALRRRETPASPMTEA